MSVNLKNFCTGKNLHTYEISEPFVLRGWKYATDGRIAVRVLAPLIPNSRPTDGLRFPLIEELFKEPSASMKKIAWPMDTEIIGPDACPGCNGFGRMDCEECAACSGRGNITLDDGTVAECPRCGDSGKNGGRQCPRCKGSGQSKQRIGYEVVGLYITKKYAELIAGLPNVVAFDDPQRSSSDPLRFDFDGGEGVIKPRNRQDEEETRPIRKTEKAVTA
jgi:hypothetical protein